MGVVVFIAGLWIAAASAQQPPQGATPSEQGAQRRAFSGRVVDGLGRPLPGVTVTVDPDHNGEDEPSRMLLRTGADGRYSGTLPAGNKSAWVTFEKDGYSPLSAGASADRENVLYRKLDWGEVQLIPYRDGEKVVLGVRELLASEEWQLNPDAGRLPGFLFLNQDRLRPALRRLIGDTHVGASARDWLDLLGDARDRDLFPGGRRYMPKREVKEIDLVDALKAAARQRHFNSSAPEPAIAIDFIAFTQGLDGVLIQCGINRAALTGITWQFVYRKVGKQWELRSAKEAGRS
jgi:hypothetical protein